MALRPYVEKVLSRLQGLAQQKDGWLARCPCPTHSNGGGDKNPSLRVTIGEGGRLLLTCRTGCDTAEVMAALSLAWRDLWPPRGAEPQERLCHEAEEPTEAQLLKRDEVYAAMLGLRECRLSKPHLEHLKGRGFDGRAIDLCRYATLDPAKRDRIAAALLDRFGDPLFSVPGFVPSHDGKALLALRQGGILIPCREADGTISALKLRTLGPLTDSGEIPRYLAFSTAQVSSGARAHVSMLGDSADEAVVTEGEIKADLASLLSGVKHVSVPGVANHAKALAALSALQSISRVAVAFDWPDVVSKPPVRRAALSLLRELRDAGYASSMLRWENAKGIDDALAAGAETVRVSPDPLSAIFDGEGATAPSPSKRSGSKWPASFAEWQRPLFPVDSLPPILANAAKALARSKQAPVDFAAASMLTVAGAMAGTTRCFEPCQGWREYASFYTAIVAPPGSRKTPVLKAALLPVYKRQAIAAKRHEDGHDERMEQMWIADATTEGVVQILKENPRGVLLMQDELVSWVLGDNKYRGGKGSDRQFWLSCWSSEPVKVDRKLSGSTHVSAPFLCALGSIQPDMLPSLHDRMGREDGFVHRILFAWPEPGKPVLWGESNGNGTLAKDPSLAAWDGLVESLRSLERVPLPDRGDVPVVLRLADAAAERAWKALFDRIALEPWSAGFPSALKGYLAKMHAYAARLSLLLALCESDPHSAERVEEQHVEAASAIVDYFSGMAHGVHLSMKRGHDDGMLPRLLAMASSGPVAAKAFMRAESIERSRTLAVFRRAEDLGLGEVFQQRDASGRSRDCFVLAAEEGD